MLTKVDLTLTELRTLNLLARTERDRWKAIKQVLELGVFITPSERELLPPEMRQYRPEMLSELIPFAESKVSECERLCAKLDEHITSNPEEPLTRHI